MPIAFNINTKNLSTFFYAFIFDNTLKIKGCQIKSLVKRLVKLLVKKLVKEGFIYIFKIGANMRQKNRKEQMLFLRQISKREVDLAIALPTLIVRINNWKARETKSFLSDTETDYWIRIPKNQF